MAKDTGFLEAEKQDVPKRPVEVRVKDFKEYDAMYTEPDIRKQASRCMDCGVPFCHTGCPLGNNIPDWNDLVYRGLWREALNELHATNNFPEFTGRVCPAPCEDTCVLNAYYTLDARDRENRQNSITIEQIEKHIAERGWEEGWIQPAKPDHATGKKVAIIGSGPAGLAAAQQLTRVGHQVTVFEKDDRVGGLLTYGIPDFKLEKINVQRRVEQMKAEGTHFRTNINVGVDITVDQLKQDFDAVLIATGAQHARKLRVPGADSKGVHYAMDFLPQQNKTVAGDTIPADVRIDTNGKRVVILGGGFTGADCLGTSNRQGANRRVHQFELMNMAPRPTPVHKEADMDTRANVLTERIVADDQGNVQRLEAVKVRWAKDASGRMEMQKVPGSEFSVEVDRVLLALGFLGPKLEGLVKDYGLEISMRGQTEVYQPDDVLKMLPERDVMYTIKSDNQFRTSQDGVFVAGDAKRGASLVVWAIWEGREAARCIDLYLMGSSKLPTSPEPHTLV